MIIRVLFTCLNNKDNILEIIRIIERTDLGVEFQFSVGLHNNGFAKFFPRHIKTVKLPHNYFWAESLRLLLHLYSIDNSEYFLHINEDLLLDPFAFKKFVILINRHKYDVFYGTVKSLNKDEIVFGLVKFVHGYKPEVLQKHSSNSISEVAFHGNFFAFKKDSCSFLDEIPHYKHAYFDFHFSLLARRKNLQISSIIQPIGFTRETIKFRSDFIRKNTKIFSKSRANLIDKFRFYKFKSGALISIIICLCQLLKSKILQNS